MRILLTRPLPELEPLGSRLAALGFEPIKVPLIEIQPLDEEARRAQLHQLIAGAPPDLVICVSRNAVLWGVPLLLASYPQLAADALWFGLGEGTAAQLRSFHIQARVSERGSDSEALLDLPELQQLTDKRVLYLVGEGGRQHIEAGLLERGGRVARWEVYRRRPDQSAAAALAKLNASPDLLTAMSGDTLAALHRALPAADQSAWLQGRLLVPSERVAALARDLGFRQVVVVPVRGGDWPADYLAEQAAL